MFTLSQISLAAHLLCLAFYLGGQAYYLLIAQPASYDFFSPMDQARYLHNLLKRQNPILLFALCLVVLTGGFMIAPLKGSMGADYFNTFGVKLLRKLGVFFLVFFVTAYQTLAVGFKIRFIELSKSTDEIKKTVSSVRRGMTITSILNIILTLLTTYLATLL